MLFIFLCNKKGVKHERSCCSIGVAKGIDTVIEVSKDNNHNEIGVNSAFKHYGSTETFGNTNTPDAYRKNGVYLFSGINKGEEMPTKLEFSSLNKKPVTIICENMSAESTNCVDGDNNNEENKNYIIAGIVTVFVAVVIIIWYNKKKKSKNIPNI